MADQHAPNVVDGVDAIEVAEASASPETDVFVIDEIDIEPETSLLKMRT